MDFRERALREARRYGEDPLVFVRELVQNARDAGARSVHFVVDSADAACRVACRDDGAGMSLDHARRFLFTLYASSKERDPRGAGRFGVGFWSLLRFAPTRLEVSSWPRRGAPWRVVLSGDLGSAERGEPPACPFACGHGTEIVVERSGEDAELLRRIRDAAFQSARFVTRRDPPHRLIDLRVNGRLVSAPFVLPRPCAEFRSAGARGVVGLGAAARVELFARGLRVRAASALSDLAAGTSASRVRFRETDGLVPQALLDGEQLEPLLARADVKDDRVLRRLLGRAERELARLVERQLALARPEPLAQRTGRIAAGLLALGLAGLALAGLTWRGGPGAVPSAGPSRQASGVVEAGPNLPRLEREPFRDPAARYAGPRASAALDVRHAPLVRYEPSQARPLLAVARLEDVAAGPPELRIAGPYAGAPCADECLELDVVLEAQPVVRLPRATGHVLDPASVRVDGVPAPLYATPLGEPALRLRAAGLHRVRYRTGRGPEAAGSPAPRLAVNDRLRAAAAALADGPDAARVEAALAWVRGAVSYAATPEVVALHGQVNAEADVLERALRVGAGDCDVQNAVLAALLQAAGQRARLVIGYVGQSGLVLPTLHAWVEWRDAGGLWRAADASPLADDPAAVAPQAGSETPRVPPASPPASGAAAAWSAAGLASGAAALGLVASRRVRRRVQLDPSHDVARLLRGALANPEAFRQAPAVFEHPLVPVFPSGRAKLGRVWDAASRQRLYRCADADALGRRVARAGGLVVDTRRPEGEIVADALGAVDLDAWAALLGRSRSGPLLGRVERAFRNAGEPIQLLAAPGLGGDHVLDLPHGRLRRGARRRVVLVDGMDATTGSALAAFSLADRIVSLLRLPPLRAGRVLGPLAAAALREAP